MKDSRHSNSSYDRFLESAFLPNVYWMSRKRFKQFDSFGIPRYVEATGDSKEDVYPTKTPYSKIVNEESYGRLWFNIYPLTISRPMMRVERFSHKADALSFITKGFSGYQIHIERNIDLNFNCLREEEDEGKPCHIALWIQNRRWIWLVTGHVCVPDIVPEFYFHDRFEEPDKVTSLFPKIVEKVHGIQFWITPETIQGIYKCPMITDYVTPLSINPMQI